MLNDYPENAIVYSRTGDVYKKKKDYDSAISMFEKALSAKPYVKLYAQQIRSLAEMQAKLGQDEFRRQDFQAAMEHTISDTLKLIEKVTDRVGTEEASIFHAHLMFLEKH